MLIGTVYVWRKTLDGLTVERRVEKLHGDPTVADFLQSMAAKLLTDPTVADLEFGPIAPPWFTTTRLDRVARLDVVH